MADVERYYDEIDRARIRRIRELTEVKRIFSQLRTADPYGVQSKSVIVLSYAAWEGFWNECVQQYCQFLRDEKRVVKDSGWLMLLGVLTSDFASLRDRFHSRRARRDFVLSLNDRIGATFDVFDQEVVEARSNLDFERLRENAEVLGLDLSGFQVHRNRLDRELVAWRNAAAHGDSPELDDLDVDKHVDYVATLLMLVADQFQDALLQHL